MGGIPSAEETPKENAKMGDETDVVAGVFAFEDGLGEVAELHEVHEEVEEESTIILTKTNPFLTRKREEELDIPVISPLW